MSDVLSTTNVAPVVESTPVERGMLREMSVQKLEAEKQDDGSVVIKRVKVQEADKLNRNGRVYPLSVMQREVAKMKTELARRPGAVDHPEGYAVPLQKLGVLWTDVYMEGNEVFGDFKILGTAAGKDLEALIDGGVEVGISSRGFGTSKRGEFQGEAALLIQEDYELVTFDAVTDPSVYDARIPVNSVESFDINSLLANEELVRELTKLVAKNLEETSMSDTNKAAASEETSAVIETPAETEESIAGDAAILAAPKTPEVDKETADAIAAVTTTDADGNTMVMATPPAKEGEETEETPVVEHSDPCVVCEDVCEAVWTTKYVNDLPDSSFAVPGQRKLPYKDAQGNLDKAHIRNALARLPQTQGLSDDEKSSARAKLMSAAKKVGVEVSGEEAFTFATDMVAETLQSFEPVRQALMAISDLMRQEMAEGDFCDVAMLANLADELNHWANWEAIEADFENGEDSIFGMDMESLNKSVTATVEGVTKMVRALTTESIEQYIAKKVEGVKYAPKVADFLQERCKSRAEVDAKFEDAIAFSKMFEDIDPVGRGVTADPIIEERVENSRASENATLAEKAYVIRRPYTK